MKRAVVLATLLAGCGNPRTEVVVTVHSSGIRIPDDVDSLRIQVADREGTLDDLLYDQPVPLCTDATAGTAGCYVFPITMTLFPGSLHPHDSVRVQVDAQRHATPVIADAALFTFSDGHSLRLDVILYANCLGNVECAKRDQACGPDALCAAITTTPLGNEPDLGEPADMRMLLDGPPPDFINPHDFTVPEDMTGGDLSGIDLLGCVPQCGGKQCGGDSCGGNCGSCPSHNFCDVGQVCSTCGFMGSPCCPVSSGMLPPMGCDPGLQCDGSNLCNPPPDLAICGNLGDPCCNGVGCFAGVCMANMRCEMPPDMLVCGDIGQPCCDGTTCFMGFCFMGSVCMGMPDMPMGPG